MREFLERLALPEDRSILAVLAIMVGYGMWGLFLRFRRNRGATPAVAPAPKAGEPS